MKRRSFIKGMLATCIAPMFLPGGNRLWKATLEPRSQINPAWVDAEYEEVFLFDPRALTGAWKFEPDNLSLRFNRITF